MEMLYRKVGRRYEPVEPFHGFPADGIWLHVKPPGGHHSSCIIRLADLDRIDARIAAEVAKLQPVIEDALLSPDRMCITDRANHIVLALIQYLQEKGVLNDPGTTNAQ